MTSIGESTPKAPDVLPCPFCGCAGEVVEIDGAWVAGCSAGQYSADDDHTCRENAISFHHATREGAVAAWNRRQPAAAPRSAPAATGDSGERIRHPRSSSLAGLDTQPNPSAAPAPTREELQDVLDAFDARESTAIREMLDALFADRDALATRVVSLELHLDLREQNIDALAARAEAAEARVRDLEAELGQATQYAPLLAEKQRLAAENADLRARMEKALDLMDQVVSAHRDPTHPDYNECEPERGEVCAWCEGVAALDAARSSSPATTTVDGCTCGVPGLVNPEYHDSGCPRRNTPSSPATPTEKR